MNWFHIYEKFIFLFIFILLISYYIYNIFDWILNFNYEISAEVDGLVTYIVIFFG